MAFKAYQLTLTGAAQRLDAVLAGQPDVPLAAITFQSLKANAADVFVGSESDTSSTKHAIRVDPGDTAPPIILTWPGIGAPIKLADFYVFGTANDVLLIGALGPI